jgi:fructose-bisphosphate aldolase, class II
MPLTHTKELFAKALKGKYALGAFNVNNMELLQAIIEACEEEKAPVMLQISKGARQYANPVYLKKLIEAAVSLSTIPIAVHLTSTMAIRSSFARNALMKGLPVS